MVNNRPKGDFFPLTPRGGAYEYLPALLRRYLLPGCDVAVAHKFVGTGSPIQTRLVSSSITKEKKLKSAVRPHSGKRLSGNS